MEKVLSSLLSLRTCKLIQLGEKVNFYLMECTAWDWLVFETTTMPSILMPRNHLPWYISTLIISIMLKVPITGVTGKTCVPSGGLSLASTETLV